MVALRYAYVLALVVWLGGMLILSAFVAPATFQVLQERQGDAGRVLAGAVFGETLRRFHIVAYVSGAVLVGSLIGMAALGGRPAALPARLAIGSVMLALAIVSGTVVSRRIEGPQRAIGGPVSSLPVADVRRAEFGRLHGLSSGLMLINMAGGLLLLYWEAGR